VLEDDWSDVELTPPPPPPAPAAARPSVAPPPAEAGLGPLLELEPASASFEPIELPAEEVPETPLLAPMHEFVPPAATTGHRPAPAVPQGGSGPLPGHAGPADGGEAVLREALSKASREVIERVVWEVVPQLAETIIRENLDRLVKARQG
jgi:hypothetical protein